MFCILFPLLKRKQKLQDFPCLITNTWIICSDKSIAEQYIHYIQVTWHMCIATKQSMNNKFTSVHHQNICITLTILSLAYLDCCVTKNNKIYKRTAFAEVTISNSPFESCSFIFHVYLGIINAEWFSKVVVHVFCGNSTSLPPACSLPLAWSQHTFFPSLYIYALCDPVNSGARHSFKLPASRDERKMLKHHLTNVSSCSSQNCVEDRVCNLLIGDKHTPLGWKLPLVWQSLTTKAAGQQENLLLIATVLKPEAVTF